MENDKFASRVLWYHSCILIDMSKEPPAKPKLELKEYEVWREGYSATGEHGEARLVGKAFARNFPEACNVVMCKTYLESIEKSHKENDAGYGDGKWSYDPQRLSSWGCRLFDNEVDARKSFG